MWQEVFYHMRSAKVKERVAIMPAMKLTDVRGIRAALGVSQSQAAALLGVSTKAVQSYEQGLRSVPAHVQKTAALLLYLRRRNQNARHTPCWEINRCDPELRSGCPAFRYHAGDLCWMLTGTLCRGKRKTSCAAKLAECQKCAVLRRCLATEPPSGSPRSSCG